jgi:hypothetical protein
MWKLVIKYLNLTAWLYWYEGNFKELDLEKIRITHLQSSHLEAKTINKFLNDIPHDILFHLSIWNKVIIYDATSNFKYNWNKITRIWIPLIIYFLNRIWFWENDIDVLKKNKLDILRSNRLYKSIDRSIKKRLSYYKIYTKLNIDKNIQLEWKVLKIEKEKTNDIIKKFIEEYN